MELRALNATIEQILDSAEWKKDGNVWHSTITYFKNGVKTSLTRSGAVSELVRRVLWDYLVNMGKSGAKIQYGRIES